MRKLLWYIYKEVNKTEITSKHILDRENLTPNHPLLNTSRILQKWMETREIGMLSGAPLNTRTRTAYIRYRCNRTCMTLNTYLINASTVIIWKKEKEKN